MTTGEREAAIRGTIKQLAIENLAKYRGIKLKESSAYQGAENVLTKEEISLCAERAREICEGTGRLIKTLHMDSWDDRKHSECIYNKYVNREIDSVLRTGIELKVAPYTGSLQSLFSLS